MLDALSDLLNGTAHVGSEDERVLFDEKVVRSDLIRMRSARCSFSSERASAVAHLPVDGLNSNGMNLCTRRHDRDQSSRVEVEKRPIILTLTTTSPLFASRSGADET